MKKIFFLVSLALIASTSLAKQVEVSFDNIVIVVFGENTTDNYVRHVSIGNPQAVSFSYKENKILLQALEEDFTPTNLIVELEAGQLYVYELVFNNRPATFMMREDVDPIQNPAVAKKGQPSTKGEKTLSDKKAHSTAIERVKEEKDYLHGVGEVKDHMEVWSGGIWSGDEYYYIKISMSNRSNVDCAIGGISIHVQNRVRLKRRVNVKQEIKQYNDLSDMSVKGKKEKIFVLIIDQITIDSSKKMIIDIWEKSPGERRFLLTISAKQLLDIKRL